MASGVGSYFTSGISYLGYKGADNKDSGYSNQGFQSDVRGSSSYYNPPGGSLTGSEDIIRESS